VAVQHASYGNGSALPSGTAGNGANTTSTEAHRRGAGTHQEVER
jgi:hypothetical protein